MTFSCFSLLPDIRGQVKRHTVGILVHHLGHHKVRPSSGMTRLYHLFDLLHKIFTGVAPTDPRIYIPGNHPDVQYVVEFDRVIEEEDFLRVVVIRQGCVQLHNRPTTLFEVSSINSWQSVGICIFVKYRLHLVEHFQHQLHLLMLFVVRCHEVANSIKQCWAKVP